MLDVITIGETMISITSQNPVPFKYTNLFTKHIAGAESNVAIGVNRLGFKSGWISKLGDDSLGDYIEFCLRGEGVDISNVKRDKNANTGLMIKEIHNESKATIHYYRKNSAASKLQPDDINADYIKSAKYIHLTGITPALSDSTRKAFYKVLKIAKENDKKVIFDPNIRFKLWKNNDIMINEMFNIINKVDILLPGLEEAKLLLGINDPKKILKKFHELMDGIVILKLGDKGSLYYDGKEIVKVSAHKINKVVDPIGAGDAFAAGLIVGLLKNMTLKKAIKLANLTGAYCVSAKGDIEGLPSWKEIEYLNGNKDKLYR